MRYVVNEQQRNAHAQAMVSLRDCRVTGPIATVLPSLPRPPQELELEGIYVPDGPLCSARDVAYVLNQQPGRLRIKDIKHAIERWGGRGGARCAVRGGGLRCTQSPTARHHDTRAVPVLPPRH